ncbi:Uncharacterized protein Fot_33417 [Forsythia ovata]|uniref:Uncharacterized protein n=1 Tax=Forsythia ovata TaxID=205694 RepID=A0ABD1TAP6_9LAMI
MELNNSTQSTTMKTLAEIEIPTQIQPLPTTMIPLSSNAPHADVTTTSTAVRSKNHYFHCRTPPWVLSTSLITATSLCQSLPAKRRNNISPTSNSPLPISSSYYCNLLFIIPPCVLLSVMRNSNSPTSIFPPLEQQQPNCNL